MKKSIAISTIVALHGLFIGAMLVQSGCNSEPESTKPTQALTTIEEVENGTPNTDTSAETVEEIIIEQPEDEVLPAEGSPFLRVPPTRPAYDMNRSDNTVIVPNDVPTNDSKVNELVEPIKPASNLESYIVQTGDTLSKISRQFNVSLDKLLETNGLNRQSRIMIGQKIYIPAQKLKSEPKVVTPAQQVAPAQSSATETYTVVGGDSLSKIAYNYKTTINSIMALNNLKNHNIRIGQKLQIQRNNKTATPPPVIESAQPTTLPSGEIAYTVKGGDTLGGIAVRYKTTVKALMEKNNIKDARKLRVGQVLRIDSKTTAPKPIEKPATTTESTPVSKPTATLAPVKQETVSVVPVAPQTPPTLVQPTTTVIEPVKTQEDPSSNIEILDF